MANLAVDVVYGSRPARDRRPERALSGRRADPDHLPFGCRTRSEIRRDPGFGGPGYGGTELGTGRTRATTATTRWSRCRPHCTTPCPGRRPDRSESRTPARPLHRRPGADRGLGAPLSPEDQTVQSMADVSPTKWHRAHVTWFFETFVLADHESGFTPFQEHYWFLFNSYYEAVGPRYERGRRGDISRPGAHDVGVYRGNVDARMHDLLDRLDEGTLTALADTVELGSTTSSSTRSRCSWTSSTSSPATRSARSTPAPPAPPPSPTRSASSTSRAGWSRSATRATASPSTTSSRATSSSSSPTASPTGWSPTASGSSSWPTVATTATTCGSPTAGAGSARKAGRRRSTGPTSTGSGSSTPSTAPGRSTPACRSATSVSTRPRPTPRGPASGSRARPSGSTRPRP